MCHAEQSPPISAAFYGRASPITKPATGYLAPNLLSLDILLAMLSSR